MELYIRQANADDSKDILEIYSYYVENTAVTFETETPALIDFTHRVDALTKAYPFYVCLADDAIAGYAYASKHRERAAYRYDVDVSIYIRHPMHGAGIGTALYQKLFEQLKQELYYNAYAAIVLPNEKSMALHYKFGFQDIGIHHKTGYKLNQWHDVLWLEKALNDHDIPPSR